jgi:hypothetical protein
MIVCDIPVPSDKHILGVYYIMEDEPSKEFVLGSASALPQRTERWMSCQTRKVLLINKLWSENSIPHQGAYPDIILLIVQASIRNYLYDLLELQTMENFPINIFEAHRVKKKDANLCKK